MIIPLNFTFESHEERIESVSISSAITSDTLTFESHEERIESSMDKAIAVEARSASESHEERIERTRTLISMCLG